MAHYSYNHEATMASCRNIQNTLQLILRELESRKMNEQFSTSSKHEVDSLFSGDNSLLANDEVVVDEVVVDELIGDESMLSGLMDDSMMLGDVELPTDVELSFIEVESVSEVEFEMTVGEDSLMLTEDGKSSRLVGTEAEPVLAADGSLSTDVAAIVNEVEVEILDVEVMIDVEICQELVSDGYLLTNDKFTDISNAVVDLIRTEDEIDFSEDKSVLDGDASCGIGIEISPRGIESAVDKEVGLVDIFYEQKRVLSRQNMTFDRGRYDAEQLHVRELLNLPFDRGRWAMIEGSGAAAVADRRRVNIEPLHVGNNRSMPFDRGKCDGFVPMRKQQVAYQREDNFWRKTIYSICSRNPDDTFVAEVFSRCGESIECVDVSFELTKLAKHSCLRNVRDKRTWFISFELEQLLNMEEIMRHVSRRELRGLRENLFEAYAELTKELVEKQSLAERLQNLQGEVTRAEADLKKSTSFAIELEEELKSAMEMCSEHEARSIDIHSCNHELEGLTQTSDYKAALVDKKASEEAEAESWQSGKVSALERGLETHRSNASSLDALIYFAKKESGLPASLDFLTEENEKFKQVAMTSYEKLFVPKGLLDVLRDDLIQTQLRLENLEGDLKATEVKEGDAMAKPKSAEGLEVRETVERCKDYAEKSKASLFPFDRGKCSSTVTNDDRGFFVGILLDHPRGRGCLQRGNNVRTRYWARIGLLMLLGCRSYWAVRTRVKRVGIG